MSADLIDLASLQSLFRPQSVAIVGASTDPEKIGGKPLAFLKEHDFAGAIYPINPKAETVQGVKAYAAISDLPGPVDMAICAVPGGAAEQTVQACADQGVRSVIMFSAGFAEVSDEGRLAQERMARIAREAGMRLMGPNCMGVANFVDGMIASFHPAYGAKPPYQGKIGLVSQSGAFGGMSCFMAQKRGIPFRHVLTTGNEADVEASDCLAFLANDPDTEVIMLYLEGVRNGPKLLAALDMARRNNKKVVAIKLGRTEAGAAAAESHTAALAGSDQVIDAIFRQYGVYRANNIEEFFDLGCAASLGPVPANDRVGLITVSGGVGVLMADDAAERGLDVAPLPEGTQARMKELVPFAGVRNPLDVTGQVLNDSSLYEKAIRLVLDETDFGSIVCFQGALGTKPEELETVMVMLRSLVTDYPDRLIIVAGLFDPDGQRAVEALGIPVVHEPTHGTRIIAALHGFGQAGSPPEPEGVEELAATSLPDGVLNEVQALAVLADGDVPVVPVRHVHTAAEAAIAAAEIDGPVVMKIVSADLQHKSEVGGVRLNISGGEAAATAFEEIIAGVAEKTPDALLDGCLVAPMVGGGTEAILGVSRDPVFGPVVMFGLGGIFVEVLKDVAFRVAPFDEAEARKMIREIRGYPVLQGVRGQPPADEDALAQALASLSRFAAANADTIESMEANPFLVRAAGQGAMALDALIIKRDGEVE